MGKGKQARLPLLCFPLRLDLSPFPPFAFLVFYCVAFLG